MQINLIIRCFSTSVTVSTQRQTFLHLHRQKFSERYAHKKLMLSFKPCVPIPIFEYFLFEQQHLKNMNILFVQKQGYKNSKEMRYRIQSSHHTLNIPRDVTYQKDFISSLIYFKVVKWELFFKSYKQKYTVNLVIVFLSTKHF